MKANEVKLLKFLNGPKQFTIPIYQRTYSWELKQCEQLFNDILKAGADDKTEGYFIGSIVYIDKGIYQVSTVPQLHVIDGQQRLTTIFLLLKALSQKLKEHGSVEDINDKKIVNYYLLNAEENDELRHKLILTQSDMESLFNILEDRDLPTTISKHVKDNYEFFQKRVSESNIVHLYRGIAKLIIIDVALDRGKDNPQLIFESLNSTGLELSQADLIRNFILMGLEPKEQTELYTEYWYRMEQNFGHSEYSEKFDRFMRDYLTIKKGMIPNIGEVYEEFKLFSRVYSSVKELVEDIYWYSKFFVNIEFEKESDEEIRNVFSAINELKVNVSYPFIIRVYNDYEKKIITKDIFLKILRFVEAYVFRRAICGIPTNSLNKTFAILYNEIDQSNYLESIMAAFSLKDSYRKFPADDEFLTQISMRDVYSLKIRNYLLDKLENHERKELVNVDTYTIEHIMPQTLTDEWKKELGPKWEETYNYYLHTLGNITLTGYNSEYSNRPFKEKQTMEGGFKDSPIRLNRDLAVLSKWDRDEITKRAKKLADSAIAIWKYPYLPPETLAKYQMNIEEETQYSLQDYKNINDKNLTIYDELKKRICNLGSDVSQEFKKLYIAFKVSTNFADLVPKKNGFDVYLNLDFSEIKDPQEWCEDVSDKGHWANGNIKFKLEGRKDLDYAMLLIKQAYDSMTGADNA